MCDQTLEARWHAKRAEYDERFGKGEHTILFAFHGTNQAAATSIVEEGFKISKLGSNTGNRGWYGAGVYFSEQNGTSQGYNRNSNGMLLCKLLVGRPYLCPRKTGCALQPGYTSHVCDTHGSEIVIFDEAAALPIYFVEMGGRAHAYGAAGGPKRPSLELKGLGRSRVAAPSGAAGGVGGGGVGGGVGGGMGGGVGSGGVFGDECMWNGSVERTTAARAKCKTCGVLIEAGAVRVGVSSRGWRHIGCAKRPALRSLPAKVAEINGFSELDAAGQALVSAWFLGGKRGGKAAAAAAAGATAGGAPRGRGDKRKLAASAAEGRFAAGDREAARHCGDGTAAAASMAAAPAVAVARMPPPAPFAEEAEDGDDFWYDGDDGGGRTDHDVCDNYVCDEEDAALQEALARSLMDCSGASRSSARSGGEDVGSSDDDEWCSMSLAARLKQKARKCTEVD